MKPVELYACPQLVAAVREYLQASRQDDVTVLPLVGSPEGAGCRLPPPSSGDRASHAAVCGPCASADPAIDSLLPSAIRVACCEELVADSLEIAAALRAGAHLFLPPKHDHPRDIPWEAWGFATRDDALAYLRDNVRELCFVVEPGAEEERLPEGLEAMSVRRVAYDTSKLAMAVEAAIEHARLNETVRDWRGRAAEYQMLLDFLVPLFHAESVVVGLQRVEDLLSDTLGAEIRISLREAEAIPGPDPRARAEPELVVPLVAGGRTIGDIRAGSFRLPEHTQRYHALLRSFAPLIGSALQQLIDKREQIEHLGLYRAILETTQEGLVITDAETRVLSVNRAFEKITGYEAQEIVGKPISILKSGVHDQAFYRALWHELGEHDHWLGEVVNQRKDGCRYVQRLSISAVRDERGETLRYAGMLFDVTREREMNEELERLAFHDSLTGLENRDSIQTRIESSIADRRTRDGFALIYIDIDRFKWVNDSYGHETGDELLVEAARRMRSRLRNNDVVARIGGDEFLVFARGVTEPSSVLGLAEGLRDVVAKPVTVGELQIDVSVSVGIALFPQHGRTVKTLLSAADEAMYIAKQHGRNRVHLLSERESESRDTEVFTRQQVLRASLERDFEVHFQPIVRLADGKPVGAEALIRLFTETGKALSPERFMATAERHGLADGIGALVAERAIAQAASWPMLAGAVAPYLSLNVTASQLNYGTFNARQTGELCRRLGFDPKRLVLEVVERTVIDPATTSRSTLHDLRQLGARIALDDFGTGYSAFAYLTDIDTDIVKIDRRFIAPLPDSEQTSAITDGLIRMCQGLKITLIAEGVETNAQAEFLRQRGVEYAQGFLFAHPMRADALDDYWQSA